MILGLRNSVVCYATAKMYFDDKESGIDEVEKAVGCPVEETTRRNDKSNCPATDWFFGGTHRKGKHTPALDDFPITVTVKDTF